MAFIGQRRVVGLSFGSPLAAGAAGVLSVCVLLAAAAAGCRRGCVMLLFKKKKKTDYPTDISSSCGSSEEVCINEEVYRAQTL